MKCWAVFFPKTKFWLLLVSFSDSLSLSSRALRLSLYLSGPPLSLEVSLSPHSFSNKTLSRRTNRIIGIWIPIFVASIKRLLLFTLWFCRWLELQIVASTLLLRLIGKSIHIYTSAINLGFVLLKYLLFWFFSGD